MATDREHAKTHDAATEPHAPATAGTVAHEDDGHAKHDPLSPAHLMGHVKDSNYFQTPRFFNERTEGKIYIPQIRDTATPVAVIKTGFDPLDNMIEPFDLKITKFMVLEVVTALLLAAIFIPLANRARSGGAPRGRFWNLFEAMVVFVRDQMARPAIGSHDGDRFTPFLLTLFFFILTCNLLGLVPWAGSPTGALGMTGALALICYLTMIIAGMSKLGPIGYWAAQVPPITGVPLIMTIILKPMILGIEILGMGIKHFVLAMRLLANMVGGHTVLAVVIAFTGASAAAAVPWALTWLGVMPVSVLAAIPLNLLELFVGFLQAYIFVFLAALFIGMAVHPH